jgi:hypothetical protein
LKRLGILTLAALLCSSSAFGAVTLRTNRIDSAKTILFAADFNGDGLDDALTYNELQINLGGRFAPAMKLPFDTGSTTYVEAVGKFNNDVYADLLLRNERGRDRILLGNGNGGFTKILIPNEHGISVDAFDFTGDGLVDVIQYKPGEIALLRGVGDGTFALLQTLPWGTYYHWNLVSPLTADFNEDGRRDFLMLTEKSIVFYIAQPNGKFEVRDRFTRFGPMSAQLGDLNGDGHVDIGFVSQAQDQLAISALFGDGTGRFPGYARKIITDNSAFGSGTGGTRNVVVGDFIAGGAEELAYGTNEGDIVMLSGAGDELHEVARTQIEGQNLDVRTMRFRSSTPELTARGFIRYTDHLFEWLVEADGAIANETGRARTRAIGRMLPTAVGGTFRIDDNSDCPIVGLTELTFDREGLFVNFATGGAIEGRGAYLPGELYVVLRMKDGNLIRELSGSLVPTPNGLRGLLWELEDTPCGRKWASHRITAVPLN